MDISDMGDETSNQQKPGFSGCSSTLKSHCNATDVEDDVIKLHAQDGVLPDDNQPSSTKNEVDSPSIGLTVREEIEVQEIILKAERELYNDLGKSYKTPRSKEEIDARHQYSNVTPEMSGLLLNEHREDSSKPQSAELCPDYKQDEEEQNVEIGDEIRGKLQELKKDFKVTEEIKIDAEIKQKPKRDCKASETVLKIDRAAKLSDEDKAIMLDLVDIALGEKIISEESLANASETNKKTREDIIKRFVDTHFKTFEVSNLQHNSHENGEKDNSNCQIKLSKTATTNTTLTENVQHNTTYENDISIYQVHAVANPPPTIPENVLTPGIEEDETGCLIGLSSVEEEEINELIKKAERVYKGKVDTTKDTCKVEDELKNIKNIVTHDTMDTTDCGDLYEQRYRSSNNNTTVEFNDRKSISYRSRRTAKEYERVRKPDSKKSRSEEFSFKLTSTSTIEHRESRSSDRSKRANQIYSPDRRDSLNLKNKLGSLNLQDILKLTDSAVIVINNFERTPGSSRRRRHSTSSSSPSPRERSRPEQKQADDTPRTQSNVVRRPARWDNIDDIKPFVPRNLYQDNVGVSPRHPQNADRLQHSRLVASRPQRCRCKLSFPHPSIHPWRTELESSKFTSSNNLRNPASSSNFSSRTPSIHPWRTELESSKYTSSNTSRHPASSSNFSSRTLCSSGNLANSYSG